MQVWFSLIERPWKKSGLKTFHSTGQSMVGSINNVLWPKNFFSSNFLDFYIALQAFVQFYLAELQTIKNVYFGTFQKIKMCLLIFRAQADFQRFWDFYPDFPKWSHWPKSRILSLLWRDKFESQNEMEIPCTLTLYFAGLWLFHLAPVINDFHHQLTISSLGYEELMIQWLLGFSK
jgi:hypothetical protein